MTDPTPTARPAAEAIFRYSMLAIPLLVPLSISNLAGVGASVPFTLDVFDTPKLLLFGVLLAIATAAWIRLTATRARPIWRPEAFWLPLAVLAWAALSAAFALNVPTAAFGSNEYKLGFIAWCEFSLLVFLVVQFVRRPDDARALLVAVAVGGAGVAAYDLVQIAGLDPVRWSAATEWALSHGFSTIGNPDTLAGYLLFPLAAVYALSLGESRTMPKIGWGLLGLMVLGGLALTTSRSAWLGAIAIVVALTLFVVSKPIPHRAWNWGVLLSIPVTGVVVAFAANVASRGAFFGRITDALNFSGSAGSGRMPLWSEALRVVVAHPLFGVGPDSFRLGWFGFRSARGVSWGFAILMDDAHSLPLMLAATVGIPAALALMGWTVWILLSSARRIAHLPGSESARFAFVGWWCALAGYAFYALVGVQVLTSAILVCVSVGVLLAPRSKRVEAAAVARWLAAACAGVLALAALGFGVLTWAADAQAGQAASAPSRGQATDAARRAVALAPWSYEYALREADLLAEDALAAMPSGNAQPQMEAARTAYDHLLAVQPLQYETYVRYSVFLDALGRNGDPSAYEAAAAVAERGLAVCPLGLRAGMSAASAWISLGRYAEAERVLAPLWDLDPAEIQPGLTYAAVLIEQRKLVEALRVVDRLQTRFPGDSRPGELLEAAESTSTAN